MAKPPLFSQDSAMNHYRQALKSYSREVHGFSDKSKLKIQCNSSKTLVLRTFFDKNCSFSYNALLDS